MVCHLSDQFKKHQSGDVRLLRIVISTAVEKSLNLNLITYFKDLSTPHCFGRDDLMKWVRRLESINQLTDFNN
jgi:hypothetical protein